MANGLETARKIISKPRRTNEGYSPPDLTNENRLHLPSIIIVEPFSFVRDPEQLALALHDCREIMAQVYTQVCPPNRMYNYKEAIELQMRRDIEYSNELLKGIQSDDQEKREIAADRALLVIRNASEQYVASRRDLQ